METSIANSMATLMDAAPQCTDLLPPNAAVFFQHPTITRSSSLQRTLTQQATDYHHQASLQRARAAKERDGWLAIAHLTAVSAPRASTWKSVLPTSRELEMTDVQYRLATRLNLGLQPADGVTLGALPHVCPLCKHSGVAHPSIRADAWHFLSCVRLTNGEISTRHDGVAEQVSRCAMLLGLRARREVKGLSSNTSLRPDLLLSLPGRTVLSDVAVCHPARPRLEATPWRESAGDSATVRDGEAEEVSRAVIAALLRAAAHRAGNDGWNGAGGSDADQSHG